MKNLNIYKTSPNFRDATTLGLSDTSDKKKESQLLDDGEAGREEDQTPIIDNDIKTAARVKDLSQLQKQMQQLEAKFH